ncbi:hypothetical protein STCU_04462 [Strigomonas culicis]|uniref:Uncharacterized protein n=1 Tax=Strigomonas culicis TaxID=28005 RepID=S9ULD6_9TRYP|nr:hypothetical protein STCU_04462 [Strigomonas culicis]|eukprot:EPY29559.1 hypothetical protein STCU_04462 [Strigomonas culicis]
MATTSTIKKRAIITEEASADDMRDLQLENRILRSERAFLQREVRAGPVISARVTTARHNAVAEDADLLRAYLLALELEDPAAQAVVREQMRSKYEQSLQRRRTLEQLLAEVETDVRHVMTSLTLAEGRQHLESGLLHHSGES